MGNEHLSYNLQPGDRLTFTNETSGPIRINVRTADGAVIGSTLPPGGGIEIETGRGNLDIEMPALDEPYTGLRLVRDGSDV